ncbi:hypothetical protein B0T18DRAFT_244323 [Schizothecium vesticola]|uniref:Uncharacterized protein n=1 Tax=Schizothecium vesticola TaxID=314040 RepID=A0AA40EH29_9PEZI|nr:hypothetical protein B0T18DRAFT_244323 [Schizothecium vesticola]
MLSVCMRSMKGAYITRSVGDMNRSTGGERSPALAHDSGLDSTAQHGTTLGSRSTAFHFAMALCVFETDDAAAQVSPTEPRLAMTAADLSMADGLNGRTLASCVFGRWPPGKKQATSTPFPCLEHGKMFRVFFSPCQACLIILSRRRVTFSREAGALDGFNPLRIGRMRAGQTHPAAHKSDGMLRPAFPPGTPSQSYARVLVPGPAMLGTA